MSLSLEEERIIAYMAKNWKKPLVRLSYTERGDFRGYQCSSPFMVGMGYLQREKANELKKSR